MLTLTGSTRNRGICKTAGVDLEFGSVSGSTLEGHIFPIVMFQGEIFALVLIISD